ncbi:MAG: methyl-accepting chemotaxis protein [Desulfobacteraceae bacterium]|nr:MAG: methyl-accepting chemotaxis protein [Desulfobacteraceae bacterium]
MLKHVQNSLKAKLLLVLAVILALSFTVLSLFIVNVQKSGLESMKADVSSKLDMTAKGTRATFTRMEDSASQSLEGMITKAVTDLSEQTINALTEEEKNLKAGMETLIKSSADTLANLLKKTTLTFLIEENHTELRKYSRSASSSDAVVYVMFLDKEGQPLPGYVDTVDDRIFGYLEKRPTEDELLVVLEESRNDREVIVHEQPVEYFGELRGTIVVCISNTAVNEQIKMLSARFADIRTQNSANIETTLNSESALVLDTIKNDLKTVLKENEASFTGTDTLLNSSIASVTSRTTILIAAVGTLCCIGTLILVGIFLGIMFIKPVIRISEGLKDIAQGEGDLTMRLDIRSQDEVGELGKWFNTFITRIHDIIKDLAVSAGQLNLSSETLTSLSSRMTDAAASSSEKAGKVTRSSIDVSGAMNLAAESMDEASSNIQMVASATEEMTATIGEISKNAEQARSITQNAVNHVQTASDRVEDLGSAAKEIEKVVESITDISEQVNLLSLNATIEAARAGEAGKGFAVVANEIKTLAQQTAASTQEIKTRVTGIQSSTGATIDAISSISGVVNDVNGIVSSIATAVEEQSATTKEISSNVGQVSTAIEDANGNVNQSSLSISDISQEIEEVTKTSGDILDLSASVDKNARELSTLSGQQNNVVGKFKI